jgi:hypothetical protein
VSKILAIVFILAGFGMIMTYQNCGQSKPAASNTNEPAATVTITGSVQKSGLIDGCHALIVSDKDANSKFIPYGIDTSQLADGQKVTISGHYPGDVYSTCMSGVILQVDKISNIAN